MGHKVGHDVLGPVKFDIHLEEVPRSNIPLLLEALVVQDGIVIVEWDQVNRATAFVHDQTPLGYIRQRVRDLVKQFSIV